MKPFLGQVPLTARPYLGQAAEYTCPAAPAPSYDPSLNCMRDARGNAVCSDGSHYPPGCPHTPPDQYFTPGTTPDTVTNGVLEGQIPTPRAPGSQGGTGGSVVPAVIGGLAGLGLIGYLVFR